MNEKQSELLAQILHAEEVNKASTNSPKTKPDNKFKFHEPKRDTVKIPEEVILVLFYILSAVCLRIVLRLGKYFDTIFLMFFFI